MHYYPQITQNITGSYLYRKFLILIWSKLCHIMKNLLNDHHTLQFFWFEEKCNCTIFPLLHKSELHCVSLLHYFQLKQSVCFLRLHIYLFQGAQVVITNEIKKPFTFKRVKLLQTNYIKKWIKVFIKQDCRKSKEGC